MENTQNTPQLATFELPLPSEAPQEPDSKDEHPQIDSAGSMPEILLAQNDLWFCRIRWIIIACFTILSVLANKTGLLQRIGIIHDAQWLPWFTATLTVGNMLFLLHIHFMGPPERPGAATKNLWAQIIFDLLAITAVVHFAGSIQTFIAFSYLFHIVISCIFFSRWKSLIILLIAGILFALCLTAEHLQIFNIKPANIYSSLSIDDHSVRPSAGRLAAYFTTAFGIWLIVWYFTSHLASTVRLRDQELNETNSQLVAAQEERVRHMLTTTHQLKAPFAAIHINSQILMKGMCGELPPKAEKVVKMIAERARRLATEIQEMLQLANFDSEILPVWDQINLTEILTWSINQTNALAKEYNISIETDIEPVGDYHGVDDHIKMIFSNLITNAIRYSHENGTVKITCKLQDSTPVITVSDNGIGIPPDKLPKIFGEYYRTNEATQHNKESSGLGLAIVKRAVDLHNIRVNVQSELGKGTIFTLRF